MNKLEEALFQMGQVAKDAKRIRNEELYQKALNGEEDPFDYENGVYFDWATKKGSRDD
ncbi:MAG: hypothetical protein LBQ52_05400 [Helicobacteraceae bacterium]|jgi:hypothetical protein|nr:hypothetical protein [Helicobacteraceae bacterium]